MAKRIQPSDAKLEITQVKSYVGQKQNMRDTLRSLGLKRPGNKVVRTADPVTVGMVNTVAHLVKVEGGQVRWQTLSRFTICARHRVPTRQRPA